MKKFKKLMLKPLLVCIDFFFLGYFHLTRGLVYVVPARVLYAIYAGLGYAYYYAMPGGRQRTFKVISQALPEVTDPGRIKYIARKSAGELFQSMIDLVMFARYPERIAGDAVVEGLDGVDKALAKGNGGICVASHVGGWAISMAIMGPRGYRGTPIIMNPRSTLTPRLIRRVIDFADSIRACYGYVLTGEDAVRRSEELLAQSGILVITVDVVGRSVVEFFGRPAAMASGIGVFGYETKSPLVPGCVLREKGSLKFRIVFFDEIEYEFTGDRETDIHNLQQLAVAAVEKQVLLAPEQWTQWGALGRWWSRAEQLEKRREEGRG